MLTEEQAKAIVQEAKKRGASKEQAMKILEKASAEFSQEAPQPFEQPTDDTTTQKIADFLGLKNVKNNLDTIWNFGFNTQPNGTYGLAQVPSTRISTGGQNIRTAQAGMQSTQAFNQARALTKQAQQEKDPVKKKALLDQARSIMNQSGEQMDSFRTDLDQRQLDSGITEKDLTRSNAEFALRRGVGQSGELASWLLPAKAALPVATVGGRIAQGAMRGAIAGGAQGVASASQADTVGEAAGDVAMGTTVGTVFGGLFSAGGEAAKAVGSKVGRFTERQELTNRLNKWKAKNLQWVYDRLDGRGDFKQKERLINEALKPYDKMEPAQASEILTGFSDGKLTKPGKIEMVNRQLDELVQGKETIDMDKIAKKALDEIRKSGNPFDENSIPKEVKQMGEKTLLEALDIKRRMGGWSNAGKEQGGSFAAFNRSVDRLIKKEVASKLTGADKKKFLSLYDEQVMDYVLKDLFAMGNVLGETIQTQAAHKGVILPFFAGMLGKAADIGIGAARSKPATALGNMLQAGSDRISPRVPDAFKTVATPVPPIVAAMQRELDKQREIKKYEQSRGR